MGYTDTLIIVAEDCAAKAGVVPPERGGRLTVASIQHTLLAAAPYTYTQEDVLFETEVRHMAVSDEELAMRRDSLREEFFAKPRACFRASPLPKSYGWGLHFDPAGRVGPLRGRLAGVTAVRRRRAHRGDCAQGHEVPSAVAPSLGCSRYGTPAISWALRHWPRGDPTASKAHGRRERSEGRRATEWSWLDALFLPLGMTDSELVASLDIAPARHGPHLRAAGEGD